jgi:hypothetical protein
LLHSKWSLLALNDFRCGAQNSVGIAAISDIKAGSGGLKSGAYDPISDINRAAEATEIPQCSSLSSIAYLPPRRGGIL